MKKPMQTHIPAKSYHIGHNFILIFFLLIKTKDVEIVQRLS